VPLGVHFIIICIWIELIMPRKMIVKMLTHSHMMMITWWCLHIYDGDEV
jgi:hypothetical protein